MVNAKIISLYGLNKRIHLYHYGILNQSNKPSPIVLDKIGNLIGQRAMQFWVLVRYLPLIISDLTLPEILKRQLDVLLLLLKIMSIVFAPRITYNWVTKLESMIEQHHKLFKN